MNKKLTLSLIAMGALGAITLTACDPGGTGGTDTPPPPPPATYTIGGNVTGLQGGGLMLQLNGAESLQVGASGSFVFTGKVATGGSYAVSVKTQPSTPPQTCTVTSGSGTVASANVTNVAVACSTNAYKVGGTVMGLAGNIVLQNNQGDDITVSADGTFEFPTAVVSGGSYAVTIKTQPDTKICTVTGDTGQVTSGPVTSVMVTCASPTTCKALKTSNPAAADGTYAIDPDGSGPLPEVMAFCDMTTDGGGYTSVAVKTGISTSRFDQPNSCTAMGLKIAIPRTKAHLTALVNKYTIAYFQTVPGVTGTKAGNYTGCAMNSGDNTCGANWKAIDGGAWFARAVAYSEPNGDYTPGCWLGSGSIDANGLLFNDAGCSYSTGTNYVCSDNAK